MPRPQLEILIPTIPRRSKELERLIAELYSQTIYADRNVDVTVYLNEGSDIGTIRDTMLQGSTGEYVCFIDDDDWIAHDYIERIGTALDTSPDYVGFQLQHYQDGVLSKPTYHSITYKNWWEDANGYYRDFSHLNPIRSEIAKEAHFPSVQKQFEDRYWAGQIRQQGLVRTECYIDDIMYHYLYSTTGSVSTVGV